MEENPIQIGNGRDSKGRFAKGNTASVGKHKVEYIEKARELKAALVKAVSHDDIRDITKKLIEQAKKGNIPAIKELLDRIFGKAPQEVAFGPADNVIGEYTLIISGKESDGPVAPEID